MIPISRLAIQSHIQYSMIMKGAVAIIGAGTQGRRLAYMVTSLLYL